MKLKDLINDAVQALKISSSPRLDADLLWGHLHGQDRLRTLLQLEEEVSVLEAEEFCWLVKRRSLGEPMAYILGKREFYGREFYVDSEVLIPRPETELLVEKTIEYIRSHFDEEVLCQGSGTHLQKLEEETKNSFTNAQGDCVKNSPQNIMLRGLEIGPGSGIISITLLLECPNLHMTAIDIHPGAVALTIRNAKFHGVENRLKVILGDGLKPLRNQEAEDRKNAVEGDLPTLDLFEKGKSQEEAFSFLVSNPPYISRAEMEDLPVDVRDFEPHTALFGGEDGLDFYRILAKEGQEFLLPGGFVALEIGWEQKEAVGELLQEATFSEIQCFKDLSGKNRLVTGVKI